jgi:AcrR family transcriptional regulator
MGRREDLLDAAITLVGERGLHGLTHRALDAAAGLPAGSTSNYFSTRDKLLNAVIERHADRERAGFDELAAEIVPGQPADLGRALARYILTATGPHRSFTLARYAILVEAAIRPEMHERLRATGRRVTLWYSNWMRLLGSTDPVRDTRFIGNYITGLVLHQLSYPDPDFDPADDITAMIEAVLKR